MAIVRNNYREKPVFKIAAIDDQEKFRPLPAPTGAYPFHLDLNEVIIEPTANKMVFHTCGDTGGILLPTYQHQVANAMRQQWDEAKTAEDRPKFLIHLGDVVYNFGQAGEYYPQFFDPFKLYPGPIFAIAGNHDADIDPLDKNNPPSLDAFLKVFCSQKSALVSFAGDSDRVSNIQPNIYWTLKTPLADFICLYSNVPRFGTITADQKGWFIEELKSAAAAKGKALIVCLHHSAYSADTNHGSSLNMQLFLNSAFEEAGVIPDLVLSGHVHNYQRFTKIYATGKVVPFVVAGAGGYAQLHSIARLYDPEFPDISALFDGVSLEKYCDTAHGFLKVVLENKEDSLVLKGEYYIINNDTGNSAPAELYDSFVVNIDP